MPRDAIDSYLRRLPSTRCLRVVGALSNDAVAMIAAHRICAA
jgi:hypothetical protein